MDVFENIIEYEKFRSTNGLWNKLGLNSPDNVGLVSKIITEFLEKNPTATKEEWEEYYYKNVRPKPFFLRLGRILFNNLPSDSNLTLDDCVECVRFRVICETWNGIVVRENNTIKTLNLIYNNAFDFIKTNGDIDITYSVDYEMFFKGKLLCGIQIKPTSYLESEQDYIILSKKTNQRKNELYEKMFSVPVITITSKMNGSITSNDEIQQLHFFYNKYVLV